MAFKPNTVQREILKALELLQTRGLELIPKKRGARWWRAIFDESVPEIVLEAWIGQEPQDLKSEIASLIRRDFVECETRETFLTIPEEPYFFETPDKRLFTLAWAYGRDPRTPSDETDKAARYDSSRCKPTLNVSVEGHKHRVTDPTAKSYCESYVLNAGPGYSITRSGLALLDSMADRVNLPPSAPHREHMALGEPNGGASANTEAAVAIVDVKDSSPIPQLVTLVQAAAIAKLSARTLERYLREEQIPRPDYPGGGGRSHKWIWSNLRPDLAKVANRPLPERYPHDRFI